MLPYVRYVRRMAGIYDLHLKLKQYPTLPDEPPRAREGLLARHIMATDVKTVCELEQVGTIEYSIVYVRKCM